MLQPGNGPNQNGAHAGEEEQKEADGAQQLGVNRKGTSALREGEKINPSLRTLKNRPGLRF